MREELRRRVLKGMLVPMPVFPEKCRVPGSARSLLWVDVRDAAGISIWWVSLLIPPMAKK